MPRPKPAEATFTHKCAGCRASVVAATPPDGQNTYCPTFFSHNLQKVETWVLEDYCQFGAWARHRSAQLFLERYRKATSVGDRKLLALKIYEELLLAAEDLELLYIALRDRKTRPVLDSMVSFNVSDATAARWAAELEASDDDVLERLGSMSNGSALGFPSGRQQRAAVAVLHKAASDMRAAAHHRTVADRVMVRAFNKLKHGFLAVSRPDFVQPPNPPDDWVCIVNIRRPLGRFEFPLVEATAAKMEEFGRRSNRPPGWQRRSCSLI